MTDSSKEKKIEIKEVKDFDSSEDSQSPDLDDASLSTDEVQGEEVYIEDSEDTEDDLDSGDESQAEVDRILAEYDKLKDQYLRTLAEYDNFRKRTIKERSELIKYGGEAIARDILEVLDTLELAISAADKADKDVTVASLKEGINLVASKFVSILKNHGIDKISGVGKEFDPNTQEALSTIPSDDVEPGYVVEEFKKAYTFKDKLLRAGQVVVAAKKEQDKPDDLNNNSESEQE